MVVGWGASFPKSPIVMTSLVGSSEGGIMSLDSSVGSPLSWKYILDVTCAFEDEVALDVSSAFARDGDADWRRSDAPTSGSASP